MALTAAAAAAVASPKGKILEASASAFFIQASNAAASAKNASVLAWSIPGLTERSLTVPMQAAISLMTALVASSPADSGMITPSPLNVVLTKILLASEASARETAV